VRTCGGPLQAYFAVAIQACSVANEINVLFQLLEADLSCRKGQPGRASSAELQTGQATGRPPSDFGQETVRLLGFDQ
jgi:hypothetical protein